MIVDFMLKSIDFTRINEDYENIKNQFEINITKFEIPISCECSMIVSDINNIQSATEYRCSNGHYFSIKRTGSCPL